VKRRILALLVASLIVLVACGTDGEGETFDAAGLAGGEEETTAGGGSEGVHTADTDLGTALVDPEGLTLYVFIADTDGESTCYGECAQLWPPVTGDTPIGSDLDASMFGTTTRTDGSEQLTVNGQPLYRYTPDLTPGDITGQGFNGVWFVVGIDGNMIGGAEATPTTTADDGYDY